MRNPERALPTPTVSGANKSSGGVQQRLRELCGSNHVASGVRGDRRVFGRIELVKRGFFVLLIVERRAPVWVSAWDAMSARLIASWLASFPTSVPAMELLSVPARASP